MYIISHLLLWQEASDNEGAEFVVPSFPALYFTRVIRPSLLAMLLRLDARNRENISLARP